MFSSEFTILVLLSSNVVTIFMQNQDTETATKIAIPGLANAGKTSIIKFLPKVSICSLPQ